MRIGQGFDVHRFIKGRPLILGGVTVPHDRGLQGHSDADVLVHAVNDALLGAAALGDIGQHFPDSDNRYANISSLRLLQQVDELLKERKYRILNIDSTLIMQQPKVFSYVDKMRETISDVLNISIDLVSVKATTTEKLGFTGREEGVAAMAVALIEKESSCH
ncbi:MAG: 2-C-methyl-D-erythritol 2,4-cyclodiphosphate synthase [candidate division KSB1 bacterium]|nr:2-C-methyl-D-erythritol 2,4-cyclodiphosphate synthase [candidate division KSB1 bacterium]